MAASAIFTLCLRAFPGADRLLVNLHRTTGLTRHLTLISPSPQSPEVEFAAEHIRERRPRLVIFGGWSPSYERILEALRDEPIDVAVYWASSPGQTDMSRELEKFSFVLSEPRVAHLLFASRPFADGLGGHRSAHYLPATLEVPAPGAARRPRDRATVTLFCSPPEYRRKNVLNCLLALAGVRSRYRLLLNGLTEDPSYRTVLNVLDLPYEERGWMDRAEYEAAVSQADLGLQVSFAESYCYVAAEHLIRGVPILGSPMVPVFDRLAPELRDRLVVAAPESVAEIREQIQYLLDRPDARDEIGQQARGELVAANARDVETARALLMRLTSTVTS